MNKFQKALKRWRKKSGYTRRSLSLELGMAHNYIWRIERGMSMPSIDMAKRIGAFFNVPETEIRRLYFL